MMSGDYFALSLGFVPLTLKVVAVFISLALLLVAAGWLKGADNIVFPGLGLIVATPLLLLLLALLEIIVLVAYLFLSPLMK